jgi:hypothetical protein
VSSVDEVVRALRGFLGEFFFARHDRGDGDGEGVWSRSKETWGIPILQRSEEGCDSSRRDVPAENVLDFDALQALVEPGTEHTSVDAVNDQVLEHADSRTFERREQVCIREDLNVT